MTNRLKLDFSLVTNEERREFLDNYLTQPQFVSRPPTADELEMMANYLLWGKDPETGLNAQQAGICQIETKHGTWDKDSSVESLDGLLENPVFNEATLRPIDSASACSSSVNYFASSGRIGFFLLPCARS